MKVTITLSLDVNYAKYNQMSHEASKDKSIRSWKSVSVRSSSVEAVANIWLGLWIQSNHLIMPTKRPKCNVLTYYMQYYHIAKSNHEIMALQKLFLVLKRIGSAPLYHKNEEEVGFMYGHGRSYDTSIYWPYSPRTPDMSKPPKRNLQYHYIIYMCSLQLPNVMYFQIIYCSWL